MVRYVAVGFGVVLLIVGGLGFVPVAAPDGLLFGIFAVDSLVNAVHLLSGALALLVGFTTERAARRMFQLFGILYGLFAAAGFLAGGEDVFRNVALNFADHVLHAIIAVLSLAIGFMPTPNRRFVPPGAALHGHETSRGI